ncbi:site-specific integrase [Embleya sp. NPDC005575]|uniref:tyrosine-type recombinase/integrase n=1 Tax=Embleya sp. NPDC005575 TaxID=3156892 RepID=UPI0033BF1D65
MNGDRVCRPCAVEIRIGDEEFGPMLRGLRPLVVRPLQLALTLEDVPGVVPQAQPVRKSSRPLLRARERRRLRDRDPTPADDPGVCTPQIFGQLACFRAPARTLTFAHAQRIRDREIPEMAVVREAIERRVSQRGMSQAWRLMAIQMARLALASREADQVLVEDRDLAHLPELRRPIADMLGDLGMLRIRLGRGKPTKNQHLPKVSCEQCLTWWGNSRPVCNPCSRWARKRTSGTCDRCARTMLPLDEGKCRLCLLVLLEHSLTGGPVVDQLALGSPGFPGLTSRGTGRDIEDVRRRNAHLARQAERVVSEHTVDPAQPGLFPTPDRDWRAISAPDLLELGPEARRLVGELDRLAREQSWNKQTRKTNMRSLRILVGWLGADAPILARDVAEVGRLSTHHSGLRVSWFLRERQLLIPAPDIDAQEAAVERLAGSVPDKFRPGVDAWVAVLRGEGRLPSPTMPWRTIRNYVNYVVPVLQGWSERVESLREVTTEDIEKAIDARGRDNSTIHVAIRSFFRALRRERLIFGNPARDIQRPSRRSIPRPIPSDRLKGLLDRAPSTKDRIALLLMAVYGIRPMAICNLLTRDVDRNAGRITVRGTGVPRIVHIDEFALDLIGQWFRERHERWPLSTNPHLLVTAVSAMHADHPPMTYIAFRRLFKTIGLNATQLRRDRILDEAVHSADPVHLMRVFGIGAESALQYVRAAHPEHFSIDPTQA